MKTEIKPIITEKSLRLIQESNTYMFSVGAVGAKLSKFMMLNFIQEKYDCTPVSVQMSVRLGKEKRFAKSKRTYNTGKQKIAYVRIPADKKLPDFNVKEVKGAKETKTAETKETKTSTKSKK